MTVPALEIVETVLPDPHRPAVLRIPPQPAGLIVFAHGARSGIASPRNSQVAIRLEEAGFATLRFDLLVPGETRKRGILFDIWLLARRLGQATRWAEGIPVLRGRPRGYFGSSVGAAAALVVAADDHSIRAVVCRGGRVDLAGGRLAQIRSPTLLLVGGLDTWVVSVNRAAADSLLCDHKLVVVEDAGHEFQEPGAIDRVASAAVSWFSHHMAESTA